MDTYGLMVKAYRALRIWRLGVEIPRVSPGERADFVLKMLSSQVSMR